MASRGANADHGVASMDQRQLGAPGVRCGDLEAVILVEGEKPGASRATRETMSWGCVGLEWKSALQWGW